MSPTPPALRLQLLDPRTGEVTSVGTLRGRRDRCCGRSDDRGAADRLGVGRRRARTAARDVVARRPRRGRRAVGARWRGVVVAPLPRGQVRQLGADRPLGRAPERLVDVLVDDLDDLPGQLLVLEVGRRRCPAASGRPRPARAAGGGGPGSTRAPRARRPAPGRARARASPPHRRRRGRASARSTRSTSRGRRRARRSPSCRGRAPCRRSATSSRPGAAARASRRCGRA